ncbi:hypothetical protein HWV62_14196 [Athelia sp. TMB]|nr:hypothetical protein HWV62_14196 [Athelia sp. TMB]
MANPDSFGSSPSSLPYLSSSPVFNSRDWLASSPAGSPESAHHAHGDTAPDLTHPHQSAALPQLNIFRSTSGTFKNDVSQHLDSAFHAYSLPSPRSDTLPGSVYTVSSLPPTPTPTYDHALIALTRPEYPLEYPIAPKHSKKPIPLPMTPPRRRAFPSSRSPPQLMPMYQSSSAPALSFLSPLLSLPHPPSPTHTYSCLSPIRTSLDAASLSLLSFASFQDIRSEPEIDRYSFMHSDDWRLSQGLEPEEPGFTYNADVYDSRCYTSPVVRIKSSVNVEESPTVDAEENPFLQKLLDAFAESSPAGSETTLHVSATSPPRSSPPDALDSDTTLVTSSPAPRADIAMMISSFASRSEAYTPAKDPIPSNVSSPLTPISKVCTPRFARKPQVYHRIHTPLNDRTSLPISPVLTPSCSDALGNSRHTSDIDMKHRYRTRSKLINIKGWAGLDDSGLRKRKRDTNAEASFQKQVKRARVSPNHDDVEPMSNPCKQASQAAPAAKAKSAAVDVPTLPVLQLQSASSRLDLRVFPDAIPYHPEFPLFYRRFPSTAFSSSRVNLYAPPSTRGSGTTKAGLCPICMQSLKDGGEGKKLWLSMKFSAYKCYHMQYYHGISPRNGLPFSPPVAFRLSPRPNASIAKHERVIMLEGKCHKCNKWIGVEGVKEGEAKVKEIYWWKHAASCHQGSTIPGECDILTKDT